MHARRLTLFENTRSRLMNQIGKDEQMALRGLYHELEHSALFDLLACYGTEADRSSALAFDLSLLPASLATLVRFFVLADEVSASVLRKCLSEEARAILQYLKLAESCDDHLRLPHLRLVFHFGVSIFCEQRSAGAQLYHGLDSFALGRILHCSGGRVLDLCTGPGTQGILCARVADQVIAVDQNPDVRTVFAVNAAFNGVTDKIELRIGDLTEPVLDERFDYVCCNPPLLPVPRGVIFPLVGDGGADGMAIAYRVLEALPTLLTRHGRCQMIGSILGDSSGPRTSRVQRIVEEKDLDVTMILPCSEFLSKDSPLLLAIAQTSHGMDGQDTASILDALESHFGCLGVDRLYSFLLSAKLGRSGDGSLQCSQHYKRNATFWTV